MNGISLARVGRSEAGKRIEAAGREYQASVVVKAATDSVLQYRDRYRRVAFRFAAVSDRLASDLEIMNQPIETRHPGIVHRIIAQVSAQYNISIADIKGDGRHVELIEARHEAIYRAVKETSLSLPNIGRIFRRDHTTIGHAAAKFARQHGLPMPRNMEGKYQAKSGRRRPDCGL